MGSIGRISLVSKAAAVAAVMFGLVTVMQPAAIAATPADTAAQAISVSPSANLEHNQAVIASVSGFAPNETVYVVECAHPSPNLWVCDGGGGAVVLPLDGSGNGSTSITALRTFDGYQDDSTHWGTVDCGTVAGGCFIAARGQDLADNATASISFQ